MAAALLSGPRHRDQRGRNAHDRNRSRRGVRRQLRVPGRNGAGARAGGLGGRHRWLSKRGDRGHHRRRLLADDRLPVYAVRSDEPRSCPTSGHCGIGRRERALAQMEAHDLDVLVLGRQANVRYVSGAPQLWVAGTRPFGPICVVVRSTGEIHLLQYLGRGHPRRHPARPPLRPGVEPDDTDRGAARASKAPPTARRVGTDALTPRSRKLLPMAFPNAELVDGELAMRAARRIKTADEVAALRGALRWPRRPGRGGRPNCEPGITEQALTGVMLEAMAAGGVSTPATQDGAWVTSREHPWRAGPRRRPCRRRRPGGVRRRACSPTATSARWAAPGRWATWRAPIARSTSARTDLWEQARCGMSARGAGQRPARGVRGRRRTAAADAGGARSRARVRPARGDRRTCRRPPPQDASSLAWCSPSPATSGRRVSARCSGSDAVLITDDGAEVLTSSPSLAPADAGIS